MPSKSCYERPTHCSASPQPCLRMINKLTVHSCRHPRHSHKHSICELLTDSSTSQEAILERLQQDTRQFELCKLLFTRGFSAGGLSAGGLSAGGLSAGGLSAGGLSAGGLSAGGLSAGGLSAGGLSAGGLSAGGLSVGGLSVGGLSVGGLSVGGLSVGGLSVGGFRVGGFRVGRLRVRWFSVKGFSIKRLVNISSPHILMINIHNQPSCLLIRSSVSCVLFNSLRTCLKSLPKLNNKVRSSPSLLKLSPTRTRYLKLSR
ncbi:hypothetical protein FHG87_004693 [Trinorchestia longiramus]|nr:hypothetical protein FHG87_004693 [Trinorchestia longiramus]